MAERQCVPMDFCFFKQNPNQYMIFKMFLFNLIEFSTHISVWRVSSGHTQLIQTVMLESLIWIHPVESRVCGGITHPNLSVYSYISSVSSLGAFSDLCRGRGTVFQKHSSLSEAAWGDVRSRKWKKWAVRVDLYKSHLPLEDFCRIQVPKPLYQTGNHVFSCVL